MDPFDKHGLDVERVLQAIVAGGNVLGALGGATKQRRRVPAKQARLVRLVAATGTVEFDDLSREFEREWSTVRERRHGEPIRLAKREFFRNIADLVARVNAALLAGYRDETVGQRLRDNTGGFYLGFTFDHQLFTVGWIKAADLEELASLLPQASGSQHVPLKAPRPTPPQEPNRQPPSVDSIERTLEDPIVGATADKEPAPSASLPAVEDPDQPTERSSLEITVHEDPVTSVWTFDLKGHQVEVERAHGLVKIDGAVHTALLVQGLAEVGDLRGEPLDFILRLIGSIEENRRLKE